MSTYGRAWDTVVAVLEEYGVDWQQKHDGYRNEAGQPASLADAITDSVYDLLVEFGKSVERQYPRPS